MKNLENILNEKDRLRIGSVGIDISEKDRSGTFIQIDHSIVHQVSHYEGLEVMATSLACEKYPFLSEYLWRAVNFDLDEYTKAVQSFPHTNGYFIRALPGVKSTYPLQACLFIGKDGLVQNVHNIIIAEEGSELNIITGCTTASYVKKGLHIGISEFFIKKGAKISFTMIHSWAEDVSARPRTCAIVEEDGAFVSNYICLKPVRSLQMYPTTRLIGNSSLARYNSILYSHSGSNLDVGSRIILSAPNTKGEAITRAISSGGKIISRGHLIGETPNVKAHLECRGLILKDGVIHAIPELEGKASDVELSHEAAVGKINKEEIEYLMARGLPRDEAISTIVRGFMDTKIMGLSPSLTYEMDKVIRSL
ncbi:TPA: hypothetical protein DCX16_05435 [bacterium]|nr:hypothetical protein [bacterium]